MMRYLYAALIALAASFLLGWSIAANAKDAELEIEFYMDPDYPVAEFRLLCITDPGTGEQVLMASMNDVSARLWETMVTGVPPGKTLDWYLAAVDPDGIETYSSAYKFKLTGRPTIIRINRK